MQAQFGQPPIQQPSQPEDNASPTRGELPLANLIINLVGIAITWIAWLGLVQASESGQISPWGQFGVAIFGVVLLVPVIFGGRWCLDHCQSFRRANLVTLVVHYLVAILFGSALIAAARLAQETLSGPELVSLNPPIPRLLGILIMLISGIVLVVVIVNLALKGLGAPFAALLTRQVVTDWLYAWTRNPMVLSALAFLVGLGLWLESGLFIIWVLVVVSPVLMVYLRIFEEKELELRFGAEYLAYKARTPLLFPRRPKGESG